MPLYDAGRHGDVEACLRRAIDAGASGAHGPLTSLLEHLLRPEETLARSRQEAETDAGTP